MSDVDAVIEAMKAAVREKMGPVIVHPEASEEVIARQRARQERAADTFVRAALRAAEAAGWRLVPSEATE